jgi:hypothetical protein
MMTTDDPITVILVIEGVLYLLLLALALKGGDFQRRTRRALMLYVAISCLWMLSQVSWRLGWLDSLNIEADLLARVPAYVVLALSALFLYLSRSFLRLAKIDRRWWGLVVAWVVVLVVLDGNLLSLADVWLSGDGWRVRRTDFSLGVLAIGWGVFMVPAALLTIRTWRQTRQPLHRNRITYWSPVLVFTLAGNVIFLAGYESPGSGLTLVGAFIATYAVLTHHLPDVRQTARHAVSYVLITCLTVAIYTAGFATMQYLFEAVPGYTPVMAGAVMALILAILFQPLLRLVQRLVNQLIFGVGYDPSRMLRRYSMSISNILDLGLLANTMVKLIGKALGSRHGRLFLVDHERGQETECGDSVRRQSYS